MPDLLNTRCVASPEPMRIANRDSEKRRAHQVSWTLLEPRGKIEQNAPHCPGSRPPKYHKGRHDQKKEDSPQNKILCRNGFRPSRPNRNESERRTAPEYSAPRS